MKRSFAAVVVALTILALVFPAEGFALLVPLTDTAVREAYFLGQRTDQKSADFLNQYRRTLPLPRQGPYVSEIRLLTPYAQVVATSNRHSVGYSAQQAAADYRGRGDITLVQIRIELTATFTYADAQHTAQDLAAELNRHLDPEDFWRAFRFAVLQTADSGAGRTFEPFSVQAEPIYARSNTVAGGGQYIGTVISLQYDAANFDSIPARVEVFGPARTNSFIDFDLAALR
jgi:hypothetical protein